MSGIIWTVLIIAVVAIGAILMIAAGKPDTFTVRRSIHIKAPREKVFALINDLVAWKSWSPWQNKDPAMRQTISPNSAGIGASQEWEGNSKVGTGRMRSPIPFPTSGSRSGWISSSPSRRPTWRASSSGKKRMARKSSGP